MSIYLQKINGLESFRVFVKRDTYRFEAGLSVKKYGRERALQYAKELKALVVDDSVALPTRRRLFRKRREEMKCE